MKLILLIIGVVMLFSGNEGLIAAGFILIWVSLIAISGGFIWSKVRKEEDEDEEVTLVIRKNKKIK